MSDGENEDSWAYTLGGVVFAIPLQVLSAFVRGWAVAKLWGWFVVPVFGLPALSYAAAYGLALLVTLLTYQIQLTKDDPKYTGPFMRPFVTTTASVVLSLVAVLAGKIVVEFWL